MLVYSYHPISKEFTGTEEADANPLEPGKFLIPANCTEVKPKRGKKGFGQLFNGKDWHYINNEKTNKHFVLTLHSREHRNKLLNDSDWTQALDTPEYVDRKAWRKYRELLRNVTLQKGFPEKIKWPERPNRK